MYDGFWPGRAKEDLGLIAEKLPFAKIRDGKFRQHPHWPVLAVQRHCFNESLFYSSTIDRFNHARYSFVLCS